MATPDFFFFFWQGGGDKHCKNILDIPDFVHQSILRISTSDLLNHKMNQNELFKYYNCILDKI